MRLISQRRSSFYLPATQDAKAYRIGMSLHRVNQVLCQFNDLDTISLAEPATRA